MDKSNQKEASKKMWAKAKSDIKACINDLKHKETRKKQIPNLLTASRMFAPLFIVPAALSGNFLLATILTASFAATDGLDGIYARKYNAISEFGKDLDPFCDKIFAGGLILPLIYFYPMMAINLGLEAVISKINYTSKVNGNIPRTNLIGKIKTCALSVLLIAGYVSHTYVIPEYIVPTLLTATAGLQMVTAGLYYKSYKKAEKEKKESKINTISTTQEVTPSHEKELDFQKRTGFSNQEEIEFLKGYKDSIKAQPEEITLEKTKNMGVHPSTKKGDK